MTLFGINITGKIVGLAVAAIVVFFGFYAMAVLNADTQLRNRLTNQNNAAKSEYSAGFEQVKATYRFNEEQNKFMASFWKDVMENKFKNDTNLMFKMLTESQIHLDTSTARDVINSLKLFFASRTEIFNRLADTKSKHDTMLQSYPEAFIYWLAGRKAVDIVFVMDTGTAEAFKTGTDNRSPLDGK